jgi:hypothetical protein
VSLFEIALFFLREPAVSVEGVMEAEMETGSDVFLFPPAAMVFSLNRGV